MAERTYQLRDTNLSWRNVDGEIVALDARSSRYLNLNEVGTVIWELLVEGATSQQIVDAVAARYEIEASRAAADVTPFLAALEERGLLA